MILLGVKTFVRKLGQNLFIALQLAVTLILMVQIVSSVESRIGLYMPIREFFFRQRCYRGLSYDTGR